jgi:hypothetical protein
VREWMNEWVSEGMGTKRSVSYFEVHVSSWRLYIPPRFLSLFWLSSKKLVNMWSLRFLQQFYWGFRCFGKPHCVAGVLLLDFPSKCWEPSDTGSHPRSESSGILMLH